MTVIGPFAQILTMDKLPASGPISDDQLEIMHDAWIRESEGIITGIGPLAALKEPHDQLKEIKQPAVAIPGLIDAHTHLCFAGNRSLDYALRASGQTYEEIAKSGGGILSTVNATRKASQEELVQLLIPRIQRQQKEGVTTLEIKTGYGLNVEDELKMLLAIEEAEKQTGMKIITTCLAAHARPPEFKDNKAYLDFITRALLPRVLQTRCRRIDIFVDQIAFSDADARPYLKAAKEMGFDIVIHADQFHLGGASLAAEFNAASADHLEVASLAEWKLLQKAHVAAVVLPGSCMGLGLPFPDGRGMLDSGLTLAIATDQNPGSAPMGKLLLQAAVFGMQAKLTLAETLAAITTRGAIALKIKDRGVLKKGSKCDLAIFPTQDYRDILYYQGSILPI